MERYKKLGKNIALLTVGNFASKLLSFFLVPLYTTVLTTEEYGTADMVTTSVNLIMPLFALLVYEAVLRYALEEDIDNKQVFSIGLYITSVGCICIMIVTPFLRFFEGIKSYVGLFVLYYVSLVFYNLVLQFIKGIEEVRVYSVAGVLNTFIYILCNIVFLLFFKIGVKGYLLSFIIGHVGATLYAFLKTKAYKYIIGYGKIKTENVRKMLKYSIPMIPNAVSWWVSNSSDKYILIYFWGVAVNGIYSVAYKIPSILTIAISIFVSAWQISSVENFGSKESKKFYADIYDKYECLLFVGTSILIGGTKILSKYLFANEFYEAWIFTPVLILASVFNSLAAFYGSIYTSAKKTKMLFYSTVIGAVGNIVLNFLMIPSMGAMGAAIATMLSYMVVWLIRVVHSRTIFSFEIKIKRDIIVYSILIIESLLVCLDINPCFIVSIISSVLVITICRKVFVDIVEKIIKYI